MKNNLSLLKVLVFVALLSSCQKTPVENHDSATQVSSTSENASVQDREETVEVTVLETLGSASSLSIDEDDLCSPARYKVVCIQHSCEDLKDDQVEEWSSDVYYYTVNSSGNVTANVAHFNSAQHTIGTWYTLPGPIVKSSALGTRRNHVTTEVFDKIGSGPTQTTAVAPTEFYYDFDCNSTDGVFTMHKVVCNTGFLNNCTLDQNHQPVSVDKTLVVANNCSNSSQGSESLSIEYLPCYKTLPGPK